jgi:hypothetical protein
MFSHLAIHISHLLLYYFFLIIDINVGIPIVSSETRKQRRTQSNLVSTRPESLRITKIIVPIFFLLSLVYSKRLTANSSWL